MDTLTIAERTYIESYVANNAKSTAVAYILWFFLGGFGAHRFYMRRPVSAIIMFIACFLLVGFFWWVIDAFLLSGMLTADKERVRREKTQELLAEKSRNMTTMATPGSPMEKLL